MSKPLPTSVLARGLEISRLALDGRRLQRAQDAHDANHVRDHVIQRMGKLRGLPHKMGQILAMRDGADSEAYSPLTDGAEPLPEEVVFTTLEEAWGVELDEVVTFIDGHGIAASLGQVHHGTLHNRTDVAIKLRYPAIESAIHSDLKLLGALAAPIGGFRTGFDMAGYRATLGAGLTEELDYQGEAHRQRDYRRASKGLPFVRVPRVVRRWSGPTVLMSTWEDGDHYNVVLREWSTDERQELAEKLVQHFCFMLFTQGQVHADLHPGNIRFRRSPQGVEIVLYDFGCVFRPDPTTLALLRELVVGAWRQTPERLFPLLIGLGFDAHHLEPMRSLLPDLMSLLLGAFLYDAPSTGAPPERGKAIAQLLGEHRWGFRKAGPSSLLFGLRAWAGMEHYLAGLGTPVSCRAHLLKALDSEPSPPSPL